MVPCAVHTFDDDEATDIALTENLCRRDLSPIEEGLAYAQLRDRGLSQQEIAAKVHRSQAHISRLLRVLELPAKVRDKIHRGKLSYATALEHPKRSGRREGGPDRAPDLSGKDAQLVSHWRRRHDRLLGGIYQVLKCRQATAVAQRGMLERLVKLDKTPLADEQSVDSRVRKIPA